MTKEELKKEARKKALEWNTEKINGKYNRPHIANWSCYEKGYLAGAEPREKRIEELEKENAKLKEKLEHRNCLDCSNHDSNMKFTKAKEIIKGLLPCCRNYPQENAEKMEQAEQFLKEIEK